jgi:hypothetical protein
MTLSETAYYIRKIIVFGGIGLVVIMIATLSLMKFAQNAQDNRPIPTPTPSASFGTLPKIIFPSTTVSSPTSFKLELIEGDAPGATPSAEIYLIPDKKPTLFSKRQALTFGKKLAFLEEPIELSATTLQFNDPATSSTLTIDIPTSNFSMKRNYPDMASFQTPTITNTSDLANLARGYFQGLRVWNDALTQSEVTYYSFDGTNLSKLPDSRDAVVARVDFFTSIIGKYPVVTSQPHMSNVYAVFTAERNKIGSVVEASFHYYPPDLTISATYPTISGQTAFEKLQEGNGYIASSNAPTAVIRKVYLAYYQTSEYSPYLQLVWVFEGDADFIALVPAIDPAWVSN